MDVGLFVTTNGVLASIFALLAAIALGVELGQRPFDPAQLKTNANPPTGKGGAAPPKGKNGKAQKSPNPADKAKLGADEKTVVASVESSSLSSMDESVLSVVDMQRRFVDGFLGARTKYDVALAILNEYQEAGLTADTEEGGATMAKQAYLSATSSNLNSAVLMDTFGGRLHEEDLEPKEPTPKKQKKTKPDAPGKKP